MAIAKRNFRNVGSGLFSPTGPGAPTGFDTYTWAARPAAASYPGLIIRISDVGPSSGSLFISDGTYWVPLGGHLLLAAVADAGLFTTSTTMVAMAGWSYVLRAGLWQKPGSMLRGTITGRRTGTLGSGGFPTIKLGWGASGGSNLAGGNAVTSAGNNSMRGQGIVSRVNDTQVRNQPGQGNYYGAIPSQADGTASALETVSATADLTIQAYGNVGNTPGVGETTWVDIIMLELLVP